MAKTYILMIKSYSPLPIFPKQFKKQASGARSGAGDFQGSVRSSVNPQVSTGNGGSFSAGCFLPWRARRSRMCCFPGSMYEWSASATPPTPWSWRRCPPLVRADARTAGLPETGKTRAQHLPTHLRLACPDITRACDLAHAFADLARPRRGYLLLEWIRQAEQDAPKPVRGFAGFLRQDLDAVTAGLTLP